MNGFTLIELIIVIGLIMILAGLSFSAFSNLEIKEDFTAGAEEVINVLRAAREKTLASEGASSFGVHFEAQNLTLFQGATFDIANSNNRKFALPARVAIDNINLTFSTSDVVFDRLTGYTKHFGTVRLAARDSSRSKIIYIYPSGSFSFEPLQAVGGRLTDTRHVHFNLGWSIQGAHILTFRFSGLGIDKNIAMTNFFNGDQSRFAWQGNLDVNGNTESFIAHTHFLTGTNTILSLTRDQEINNLSVEILIDGFQIGLYSASGDVTVGTSGGVMTAQ